MDWDILEVKWSGEGQITLHSTQGREKNNGRELISTPLRAIRTVALQKQPLKVVVFSISVSLSNWLAITLGSAAQIRQTLNYQTPHSMCIRPKVFIMKLGVKHEKNRRTAHAQT